MAHRPGGKQKVLEPGPRGIDDDRDQHHQDDHTQEPAPDETVEGEGKDVEGHILVPDRILDVERLLVEKGEDRLPLTRRDPAEEQAEQNHDQQGKKRGGRAQQALADADRREAPAGVGVEGDQQICRPDHAEKEGENEERPDLRLKPRPEHAAVAERAEPQIVGVQGRERLQEEEQKQQGRGEDDPEDSPSRDPDGGEAGLGGQAAERRLATLEESARRAPRHGRTRRASGTVRYYPPLPLSAGADCTSPRVPSVMGHRL